MKFFTYLLCFLFLLLSFPSFSVEEEVVFELKREIKKSKKQTQRKKTLPLKFKRKSFSFSEDFLIFNEKPASDIKKGTFLRVNIPYSIIASFNEKFPVYGIVTHPLKGVISGTVKGIKKYKQSSFVF